jgi:dTDP-glucose pyrophosphorylase
VNANWQLALIAEDKTIRDAAELLTASSLRITLVVDRETRLQGTVTDGDIRRALIAGHDMSQPVSSIMQSNPTTISSSESRRTALNLMNQRNLMHIPIVEDNGVVVGLESLQDLLFQRKKPNPVLLMAGGFGKRLYPLTRTVPKPLLPIGKKPILEGILEQLSGEGFSQFFISVHYQKEQIQNYFGDGSNWGVNIHYLEEEKPLGTAGALASLDFSLIEHPIVMMNGDLVTRLNFEQLLDFHSASRSDATICVRDYEIEVPFGVVEGQGMEVKQIVEKPVQHFMINAGIYVLDPSVILLCKAVQYRDMPDLLREILAKGKKVNMFPIHEYWIDIGETSEYARAQREIETEA